MRVTRIAYCKGLNKKKYAELKEQAAQLGRVRTEVWQRYGSIAGVGRGDRTIWNRWLKEKKKFSVSANAWKETLRDAMAESFDSEIGRWTLYNKVKSILLERTERLRLGLLNRESGCSDLPLSTESELPNGQLCPIFWG